MSSSPYFSVRLLTLSLLYFVQGAPYGFQTACLPIILREVGLSFTALGAMKLLFLPWVCKPLYAPLIETTRDRDWWLTTSMLALAATCAAAGTLTAPEQVWALSALMLALNLFSAAQDVATDSLAVRVLSPSELGAGNTVQVVAYKAGSVFAGGVLLWVKERSGWGAMFGAFASVYLVTVALFRRYRLVQKSNEAAKRPKRKEEDEDGSWSWRQLFSVEGTAYLVFFVSFYKLSERAEQTFSLFMVDKGVPAATLAAWSTVMRSLSLLGSAYGGGILSAVGDGGVGAVASRTLTKYQLLRTVPVAAQLLVVLAWGTERVSDQARFEVFPSAGMNSDAAFMYAGFACTSATLFCAGVVTTAAFTLMMRLSQKVPSKMQGTHYTLLATFEVLGKLCFASVAGWMIDVLGLANMFAAFVVLGLAAVPAAAFMPKSVVEDATAEQETHDS